MSARYAIYYCPEANEPITHAAATFLGRDAFGRPVEPRAPLPGLTDLDLDGLTDDPRGYGFHATLKAPFELAAGRSEQELVQALEAFCKVTAPFSAPIEVSDIGPFIAFKLAAPCDEMNQLHQACVRQFEPFRAPLSDADLERRRRARLTAQQEAWLVEFGYPYIMDDFRFHMTLTGAIKDDGLRAQVVAALSDRFADFNGNHRFETLALFKQETRHDPFYVIKISRLGD
jgi:putative phosphonate metabolism protein